MIGPAPVCLDCTRLHDTETGFFCDAYPEGDGIPVRILVGGDPHTEAVPGDHGLRFEAKAT